MAVPNDRKYSQTHEWFKADGDVVSIGITQFAADELTDITFVEMPEVGATVGPDEAAGGIESVKAYSELYSAVKGKVVELNTALEDNPGLINEDAFDDGWIFKVEADDLEALNTLMDAKAYRKHITANA
jgi:glycine cleavage system H protein